MNYSLLAASARSVAKTAMGIDKMTKGCDLTSSGSPSSSILICYQVVGRRSMGVRLQCAAFLAIETYR